MGKGAGPYTGPGMTGNQFLINGTESPTAAVSGYQFVNGIDGYCAGSLVVENECIVDPVAGLIHTQNANGVPRGTAAGITYPGPANNGNNVCRGVAIWHLVTGALPRTMWCLTIIGFRTPS